MPLSPSQTRALLQQLDHRPRKPLGQNFLIDGNIVRKSIELADVRPGDRVVEVGPGLGTLSRALLEAGAEVWAVELDARLHAFLDGDIVDPRWHLLHGDAVKFPRAGLGDAGGADGEAEVGSGGFKVVANLPYAITSPWMDRVIREPLPECMVLMMQKEAAQRLTAEAGSADFSALTVAVEAAFTRRTAVKVSRNCFYPVPGVDSVLLVLDRREHPRILRPRTREIMRQLLTQRRKQVRAALMGDAVLEPWWESCICAGLSPQARPGDIPTACWLDLDSRLG